MSDLTFEEIKAQHAAITGDDMTLEEMLEMYRDIKTELDWPLAVLKTLEKKIRKHVKDYGEMAQIDGARIEVKKGYTRQGVDTNEFLRYAENRKYLHKFIKEIVVSPGVSIKVDPVRRMT